MATEDLEKKDLVRTVLKDVLIKSLGETLSLMKLEVSDDNISRLQSYQETIKRKLGAVKTIEKELIDLYKEPLDISRIINEGMEFEVECNTKLNILEKFLNNHVKEDKKPSKSNSTHRSPIEEVKLPRMEIRRLVEILGSGKHSTIHLKLPFTLQAYLMYKNLVILLDIWKVML